MTLEPASLAAIRELAGYSQAELARITGISQGHISDLERGDKKARPVTIRKLAEALRVPLPSLLAACMHGAGESGRSPDVVEIDLGDEAAGPRPMSGRPSQAEMVA